MQNHQIQFKAGENTLTNNRYEQLLKPLKIKSMELRNRVVMPPMTTMLGKRDHTVSDANIAYMKRVATSGAALYITEVSAVHPDGIEGPGMLGIYDDRFISGLGKLASQVHKQQQKAMVQIFHVGRESQYQLARGRASAPSALAGIFKTIPREMNPQDIAQVIKCFGKAAARARAAGFDGVELHAAHGYLLMQFLSGLSNQRLDEYGGSFRERSRFILEVIREVRRKVGQDFPISIRISAEEYAVGGYTLQDMLGIAPLLVEAGVDIIHTSFGTQSSPGGIICPTIEYALGFNAKMAASIKNVVDIPVIAVGRFTNLSVAERTIARGDADLVAFGRQHLADPNFFRNAIKGEEEATIECLACNKGCIERLYKGKGIRCAINPMTGQELVCPEKAIGHTRKVLVVGAGPGGLTAAVQAARLGHQVLLVEKEENSGGQVRWAAQAPFKDGYGRWINKLTETAVKAGVNIKFNQIADLDFIKKQAAEVVIIATGARNTRPSIPGINLPHVINAWQILQGKAELTDHVLIIGGGLVGMETADYLREKGISDVVVVDTLLRSPVKQSNGRGYRLHKRLNEAGYQLWLGTRVIKIEADKVIVDKAGKEKLLKPIRQVVYATGSSSCNELGYELEKENVLFHIIGDAKQPRSILEAVEEGAQAAWSIK